MTDEPKLIDDELKLLGLKSLALENWKQREAIMRAAAAITSEVDEAGQVELFGHTADWLEDEGNINGPSDLIERVKNINRRRKAND